MQEKAWRKALNDGVVASAKPAEAAKVSVDAKKLAAAAGGGTESFFEQRYRSRFYPSSSAWDGRFANNGWMQEAPDPITKLVWGNAAMIFAATAEAQNMADGEIDFDFARELQSGSAGDGAAGAWLTA